MAAAPPSQGGHAHQGRQTRTVTNNLSAELMKDAIETVASSDNPFFVQELLRALDRQKDSSHGEDNIMYSMLCQAPAATSFIGCATTYCAWAAPNGVETGSKQGEFRPIYFVSSASKIMEVMVLHRLWHMANPPKPNTFGCHRHFGQRPDRQASSRCCFLDLEKAFELADQTIILAALSLASFCSKNFAWVRDFLTDSKGMLMY